MDAQQLMDQYMANPGSFDYFNPGLASLIAQMQGQYLSNDQFYANLDWQKQQWADQMRQWGEQFGWGKNTDSAGMALQQQLASGYLQSNPFLTPEGGYAGASGDMMKTLEREMGEGNLGLGYLSLLGSLSGPRDWLQYARTVRGAEGTGLPTWAESLINNQQLPAFGAAYQSNQLSPVYDQFLGQSYNPYGVNQQASLGAEQAMLQAAAQGQNTSTGGSEAGTQQPSWSVPLAHKITQAQWQRMMPSEQQMLMGAVEDAGGYADDYLTQMQRSWQPRKVNPTTYWG